MPSTSLITHASPVGAADPERELTMAPVAHYLWAIRRSAWKIALFVTLCVSAAWVYSKRQTPLYESTAIVDIDRQAPSVIVGQETTHESLPADDEFISTQIRLVKSDIVLRPIADKYHLLEQEHQIDLAKPERAKRQIAAPVFLKRLTIVRPPNTFLLTISYLSPDPRESADVANGIAESFLRTAWTLRVKSASNLASFMEQQLDGLKGKMEKSSQALAAFERELNVINPDDKTNILSARLLQLNTDFANAEDERVRKQTLWSSVKDGSVASLQSSGNDQALALVIERLNEAQQRFATVKAVYGPVYPEYRKAENEVAELQKQFDEMRKTIGDRIGLEYQQATARERMLLQAVTSTKAEYDALNARSFQYEQLRREADADKKLYDELTTSIQEARINAGFESNAIRIADPAKPAADPVLPATLLNVVLAMMFSVIVGCGAAIAAAAMDTTARDAQGVSRYLGVEVLGTLPAVKAGADFSMLETNSRLALLTGKSEKKAYAQTRNNRAYPDVEYYAEAIHTVRSTVFVNERDNRTRSLLMTSASPGEGKTTTAVNLAIAHAEQGRKTLIIDADLRRPSVHRRLNIPDMPGFSDVLNGEATWNEVVHQVERVPELSVIAAGSPSHRASRVIGTRMADVLDEVCKQFDLVVIDAPSMLGFADPLQIAKVVDAVVVVGEAGTTRLDDLNTVLSTLRRVRANVLGVVLNRVRPDTSSRHTRHYLQYRNSSAA